MSTEPHLVIEAADVLTQAAMSIRGHLPKIPVTVPMRTTYATAVEICRERLAENDGLMLIFPPRSKASRRMVRDLALQAKTQMEMIEARAESSSSSLKPCPGLRIRNAVDAELLPDPRRASPSARARLKGDILNLRACGKEPYNLVVRPLLEDQKLPLIPGKLRIHGFDMRPGDPSCTIESNEMLFDTGAHGCFITADVLPAPFLAYLRNDPFNDPYRCGNIISVQVDATFGFAEGTLSMACVFRIVSRDMMPNKRSGVLLGQSSFIDHLIYRSIPRHFILARGEEVDEKVWGDIVIESYVNHEAEIVELGADSYA